MEKGEKMKTIALFALLTFGLITVAGCHWGHRRHHYSDRHDRR
jgi:hypothetical protein